MEPVNSLNMSAGAIFRSRSQGPVLSLASLNLEDTMTSYCLEHYRRLY